MLSKTSRDLLVALQRTLPNWHCSLEGHEVRFDLDRSTSGYRPPRGVSSWTTMLDTLASFCSANGIAQAQPLPLYGLGDAELTFSAVQALDPYLKYQSHDGYRSGYLPQPVVRLSGPRDQSGNLLPGYASGFVNVSIVEPITTIAEHAILMDVWLGALSQLGLHARQLSITGSLTAWSRPPVSGITLRFRHNERELGDAVLLWNEHDPSRMVTDIGSGLERLAWIISNRAWQTVVYGELADQASPATLDALRTATLIVATGTTPGSHGPGSIVRRLIRTGAEDSGALGTSRIVRWAHRYWSRFMQLPVPWAEVCRILDAELYGTPEEQDIT